MIYSYCFVKRYCEERLWTPWGIECTVALCYLVWIVLEKSVVYNYESEKLYRPLTFNWKLFWLLCHFKLIKRFYFSSDALCYFSKKLNILMDSSWKMWQIKGSGIELCIVIIVFVATPGGGYSPVQKLFSFETYEHGSNLIWENS